MFYPKKSLPFFQLLFMSMLICYSGFVTTSVKTKYYERHIARVLEYYVYFWGFGDLLEEFFSCFVWVSFLKKLNFSNNYSGNQGENIFQNHLGNINSICKYQIKTLSNITCACEKKYLRKPNES